LVKAVVENFESSPLNDSEKVLFRFLDRVNSDSPAIQAGDLDTVRAAGWTDEQIYYAITVCALFNFYNRWIDATGVHPLSEEAHREGGKRSAATGYVRK
jgi:alkylhydroperoxidase family enzyme